ncbi:MAG TPA: N-acetylmuramoyl-L-alanine amidase [Candidatus Sulfotelmatobacter sp.]|nr:N-acetylmuramoyl-L-alanine amidase [Candidatus Sulfotelmatobacter sp.]
MNHSRARLSDRVLAALACAVLAFSIAPPARAQQTQPLWFQGTQLILARAIPLDDDLAVPTRDPGMQRFLQRLGATVSYDPQQKYVVVTAQDRRTIVFTVGDAAYTVGGVRARAPFAPHADGDDVDLPFFTLARALYVDPVPGEGETVLQPRIGALEVRTDGGRTTVTVRAAMPLVTSSQSDTPEQLQLAFVGQGSAVGPLQSALGPAVRAVDVGVGGSARVPTTTLTIVGAPGSTHRILQGSTPATLTVVFDAAGGAGGVFSRTPPTPPPLGTEPATEPGTDQTPSSSYPQTPPTAAPPLVAGRATVTDLQITPGADDALTVQVALSGAVSYTWHRLADHRWYVDLANTTLTGPGRNEQPSFGAVQSVRVAQIGSDDAPAVRIAFSLSGDQQIDLAPVATGLAITVETATTTDVARSGGGRTGGAPLVASAVPTGSPPSEMMNPDGTWKYGAAASPTPAPAPVAPYAPVVFGNGSRIIVIDPGHGGEDHGTEHNGLTEKTLTLEIADRLKTLLIAQGWTVRMTRDTDIDPVSQANLVKMRADGLPNPTDRAYLQTRCDVANDVNARLFISIHVNSAPIVSARGTTFFWYKPQDLPFAQALEKSVIAAAGTPDDGTRHANFYVIRHTTMPAVLIETAFITNPEDVALLRESSFLQHVAQGIASGVRSFAGSQQQSSLSAPQ